MNEIGHTRTANIAHHYKTCWGVEGKCIDLEGGLRADLPRDFRVLQFQPHADREMWTYATCGMSDESDDLPIELHIFSKNESVELIELLFSIAHYHRTGHPLGLGHTVNFGKPWLADSLCEFGLISLPYLDGPDLENIFFQDGKRGQCLWLIPITRAELDFKKSRGLDALEERLEEAGFNYLDPARKSVC
jgi:Suppressor of fused protein (SUFU)